MGKACIHCAGPRPCTNWACPASARRRERIAARRAEKRQRRIAERGDRFTCDHVDGKGRRCVRKWHVDGLHQYREPRSLSAARRQVRRRAGGRCEAAFAFDCVGKGSQAHHVVMRSHGGSHSPDNLLWVCDPCHSEIHQFPEMARDLGLLRSGSTTRQEET